MQGIELSERCFFEVFLPLVRERMPDAEAHIAAGLVGGGSECLGFDDGISADHDFSNGFYVWLTEEDDIKYGVGLSRIYRESVEEPTKKSARPRERGVVTVGDFYMRYTARRGAPQELSEWLYLPDSALCEATNGKVFLDNVGEFSRIRNELTDGMPEDVRKKKLAARVLAMAQAGQYNYKRCLDHGERGAARLAAFEFSQAAISAIFLLNRKYAPYYKWSLRAMRGLEMLSGEEQKITELLSSCDDNVCLRLIEEISASVASELRAQGLSSATSDYLEPHAFSVFESISDRRLRSLHIMEG